MKLTLPAGFTAGETRFPVPRRIESSGGVVYGYEKDVLLTVAVTPPADLGGASAVPITAAAGWCVCSDVCVIGHKQLDLQLPVVATPPARANAEVFDAWNARMPASEKDVFSGVEVGKDSPAGPLTVVTFHWAGDPPANLSWLPGPADDVVVTPVDLRTEGKATTLRLKIDRLAGVGRESSVLSGVLAYHDDGGPPHGVAVTLDRRAVK